MRLCKGVDDFGGGVGAEATTSGVRERLLGAGEAGALTDGMSTISPSGLLITSAALFFGLWKADGVAGALGCGVLEAGGTFVAVCGWPRLEFGLSEICDEVRDIGCGCAGVLY